MLTFEEINTRYRAILAGCRAIFQSKGNAYGATWAAYRWVSLCDQLWIKVKRIRQLEGGERRVPESAEAEYVALVNYAVIFLMRLRDPRLSAGEDTLLEDVDRIGRLGADTLGRLYDAAAQEAFDLYLLKNHDYNNAWQEMDLRAITDMLAVKVLRIRHIIAHTAPACGPDVAEQLHDIINYSLFALILLGAAGEREPLPGGRV